MNDHNFQITNTDTDSISFCKPDCSPFSKSEIDSLMNELNRISPEFMIWEHDGYFCKFLVLRAKNYIMVDENGNKKVKGSALKSSTLEPAIKKMIQAMIDCLLEDNKTEMVNIYNTHIRLIRDDIVDIKPWAKKLQLSPKTFNSPRLNETKIVDAIKGTEYKSGDRIYVFTKADGTLGLVEHFAGEYDKNTYIQKLYKAILRFETILPVKELFINYSLKKNKELLELL
jgi:hypothetical protein